LAAWSSWGAVPGIFDDARAEFAAERAELRALLTPAEFTAARRTTINAHYTDPAYVEQIWNTLGQLGFSGGRVLEPGCGSGTFLGLAPQGAALTGIELDPVTARIARALYPQAEVKAESFADTRYPSGYFDAAVGNVPFADVRLHDKRHNAAGHAMHNHFILKSLDLTRPGGLVAVLTSSFTMDATNPAARREMHASADLLGAVRLPSGAHRRTSGTEVVTDLLVFRRREPDDTPGSDEWVTTQPRQVGAATIRLGGYFAEHPEQILGRLEVGQGMYGDQTLLVRADELADTAPRLQAALGRVTETAIARGDTFTPRGVDLGPQQVAYAPDGQHWQGHLAAHPDGGFTVLTYTGMELLDVPRTQAGELRELLSLRDQAVDLLSMEAASSDDSADLDTRRTELADSYRRYVAGHGPINRYTLNISATAVDKMTGESRVSRRTPPVMRLLRRDPFGPLVKALEVYDDVTQTARPATVLSQRVVASRPPVLGADTAADALALTLNQTGTADLEMISALLGVDPDQARRQLGELVFDDPTSSTGQIIPATEYLSGNVRVKLDQARQAAPSRPDLAANVAALEAVQPADLGADEISARIGAVWISAADHQQFLTDILGDRNARVEHAGGSVWGVAGNTSLLSATSEWGTDRRPAHKLMNALLEQKQVVVHDEDIDGRRVINETDTEAAREKADLLQERFAEWVWEDPARADRLTTEYNRRFNSLVLRDYTGEGQRLTLPGMARNFEPRPHQLAAVARMISEPAVGLFHQVGAGKTAEMVMGVMELRRLDMVSKPVVVVPNHMLEQFSREWLQLYPQARLLAASSEDLQADRRREFVARTAANDWDAVIMTRSAFERIPVSKAGQAAYIDSELTVQRSVLDGAQQGGQQMTVKRLEKAVLRLEERLRAKLDGPEDAGLSFEDTGIDYLCVDEMHDYKNLATTTNISDAAIDGSNRSSDLHMKTELLRRVHGSRVITAATATPIANSITEAHVMQRFLRPDLLIEAGVENFDAWAATFGQVVTEMEMNPTGSGFRQKSRFARFQNVPEMLKMWQSFADVKTAEDLNLPVPDLAMRPDGRRWPETVVIPPSEELLDYIGRLGDRVERMSGRGGKGEDNMLLVTTDGRKAALDLRLIGQDRPDAPQKTDVVADRVAQIYRRNADNQYPGPDGQPSSQRGALQIVFCDQSTPNANHWNVYDQLRADLVDKGVPAEKIRFIHEAANDVDKARLFAAARSGHISVLIGSTAKMGVGTNVQARAVALHHLDCPWRPADLEQRDGRIMRQGNLNPEVQVIRYTVEKSFDAYSWQTVERKATFINQVMRGRLDLREIEDIGDSALSMAETKAITSGDPLVRDKAEADKDLARLERLARAHQRNLSALTYRAHHSEQKITAADADEPGLVQGIARSRPTAGDQFAAQVGPLRTGDRTEAGAQLSVTINAGLRRYGLRQAEPYGVVARLGGHEILATQVPSLARGPEIQLELAGVPRSTWTVPADSFNPTSGIGVIRQIENHIDRLPVTLQRLRIERDDDTSTAGQAREQMTRPFKHQAALGDARTTVSTIAARMAAQAKPNTPRDTPDTAEPPAAHQKQTFADRMSAIADRMDAGAGHSADRVESYEEHDEPADVASRSLRL